jgi:hypothetical protein
VNLDAAQRDSETVWLELSWGHWCDDLKVPDWSLFEDVSDALRGLSPADLGELGCTYHRYGIKVWLGPATKAPRGHYEAQVIGPQYVPEAAALAIEVGFHSEHPEEADNEAVIAALVGSGRSWACRITKRQRRPTPIGERGPHNGRHHRRSRAAGPSRSAPVRDQANYDERRTTGFRTQPGIGGSWGPKL